MDEIQVMTAIQLKAALDSLFTKMVQAAFRLPFKIIETWFQCNLKMFYLVVDSYVAVSDVLRSAFPFKSREANEPEATASTEAIVQGVKKVRRTVMVQIDNSYSLKFKADNEEAVRRLDELRAAKTREEHQEALNRINEMNERFRRERKELFGHVENLGFDEIFDQINEDNSAENDGGIDEAEHNQVSNDGIDEAEHNQASNLLREQDVLNMNGCIRQLNGVRKLLTSKRRNGVPKNRLNATNIQEQFLRVSYNLIGELHKLNQQIGHLAEVSEKMADMQVKLGAGRTLLCKVEAERNEMARKLLKLEQLIKEEETYLDDFSCESGFEENETPVSH